MFNTKLLRGMRSERAHALVFYLCALIMGLFICGYATGMQGTGAFFMQATCTFFVEQIPL